MKKDYVGKDITIHDDRSVCSHVGYCTEQLPKVFRHEGNPWIDPDAEDAEVIAKLIRLCPSGALTYTMNGVLWEGDLTLPSVLPIPDMGLVCRGSIKLKGGAKPACPTHYMLCRCGQSKNKPFCDGTHYYVDFKG